VDRTTIGGSGLVVNSAWQQPANVAGNGDFSTASLRDAAHLLFVEDSAGAVRGITMATRGGGVQQGQPLAVDAASTAMSLLMLTPGIATSEPGEASARAAELGALPAFATLSGLLGSRLPTAPVPDVVAQPDVSDALMACVNAWLATRAVPRGRGVSTGSPRGDFGVWVASQTPPHVTLSLKNAGWRYLSIARRDLRADGSLRGAATDLTGDWGHFVEPCVAYSLGSIFTGTALAPSEHSNLVQFGDVATYQYWARGPGWAAGGDPPPSDLPADSHDTWGVSIFHQVVFPFIDVVTGLVGAFGGKDRPYTQKVHEIEKLANDLWRAATLSQGAGDLFRHMGNLRNAGTESDRQRHFVNAFASAIGILVFGGESCIAVQAGLVTAGSAVLVGKVLALASACLGAANMACCVAKWAVLPPCVDVMAMASSDGYVVVE